MANPWKDEKFVKLSEQSVPEKEALLAEGVDLRVQSLTGDNGTEITQDGNAFTVGNSQDLSKVGSPEFKTVSLTSMKQGSVPFVNPTGGSRKLMHDSTNFRWDERARSMRVNDIQYRNFQVREYLAGYNVGIMEDEGRYYWDEVWQLGTENTARAICPLGNGRVLAGTSANGLIYLSCDHGLSWASRGIMIAGETHVYTMCYLGNGIVIAGTRPLGKVGRSTDYGESFTSLGQLGAETYIMSSCYCGNGIALVGTNPNGKIYRSTDYGATWADLGQMFSETQVCSLCYIGGGVVLAGTQGVGKILRSTDYGATWIDVNQNYQFEQVFSLCYLEAGVCLAGTAPTYGNILRSTDHGQTWTILENIPAANEILALTYIGNGIALAGTAYYPGGVAEAGHIFRSYDWGETWTDLGAPGTDLNIRTIANIGDGVALAGSGDPDAKIYRCEHMRTPGLGVTWNPEQFKPTLDAAWHVLSTPWAKEVRISIDWASATATHYMYFYTRRRGSIAAFEGIIAGHGSVSGMIVQQSDNPAYPGDIEYNGAIDGGTLTAYITGYIS